MPYIKISDPNIIDLAAWHQVINVINQHSDSLTAITNNFGAQGSGVADWNGSADVAKEYEPGSQRIVYGRTKIDSSQMDAALGDHMMYLKVDIVDPVTGTKAFSAKPIVTATAVFGATAYPPQTSAGRENVICTISAVEDDQFVLRLVNARSTSSVKVPLFTASNQAFYINWIAIGPK
jgi:hypothetical protein